MSVLLWKSTKKSLSSKYVQTTIKKEFSNEGLLYKVLSQGASETPEIKLFAFKIYLMKWVLLNFTTGNSDALEIKLHTVPHLKALNIG